MTVSTWEERMARRGVDRAHAEAVEMHAAECAAAEQRATLTTRFAAFCDDRGGAGGYRNGCFSHVHYAHGNASFDAATGELLGTFSIVLTDDMPPVPKSCPICDDFNPPDWTVGSAKGKERSDP